MNWGTRITVLYLAFVAMIVTLVLLCGGENTDLEYKDYYARELKFQDKLDAVANEKALSESIGHDLQEQNLILRLPAEWKNTEVKGDLHFYRPSDAKLDLNLPMNFDAEGNQRIARAAFSRGLYKLRMEWVVGGKNYFKEEVLNL